MRRGDVVRAGAQATASTPRSLGGTVIYCDIDFNGGYDIGLDVHESCVIDFATASVHYQRVFFSASVAGLRTVDYSSGLDVGHALVLVAVNFNAAAPYLYVDVPFGGAQGNATITAALDLPPGDHHVTLLVGSADFNVTVGYRVGSLQVILGQEVETQSCWVGSGCG